MKVRRYVAILEGSNGPQSARPIIATEDPVLVRAVIQAVQDRLAEGPVGENDILPFRPEGMSNASGDPIL